MRDLLCPIPKKTDGAYSKFRVAMCSQACFLLQNKQHPIQMQDKAKGTQAKYAERIDWIQINNFLCLFSQGIQCRASQHKRKHDVTKLSNVNIYTVRL